MAVNTTVYEPRHSDLHAEAHAIGWCARRGVPTASTTAYVNIPPCKSCFACLLAAGVARVVTAAPRRRCPDRILESAARCGIEMVFVEETPERVERRLELGRTHEDFDRVHKLREERTALRQERRERKLQQEKLAAAATAGGGENSGAGPQAATAATDQRDVKSTAFGATGAAIRSPAASAAAAAETGAEMTSVAGAGTETAATKAADLVRTSPEDPNGFRQANAPGAASAPQAVSGKAEPALVAESPSVRSVSSEDTIDNKRGL
ncbi:unnamed protein product [Phaeothamnion confervicola]